MSKKLMLVVAVIMALFGGMFTPTPATAAVAIGCTTDSSDGAQPGDDLCTLETDTWIELTGEDYLYPDANVLKNDGEPQPTVFDVGDIDPEIATVSVFRDSQGYTSFGIYINRDAPNFSFTYLDSNNVEHMVAVTTHTTPLAAPPTVKKAKRKGFIKVCEPTRANGGRKVTVMYGSFRQPEPDGVVNVRAGVCKLVRVHRHRIDWIAIDYRTGYFLKEGHVRNIRLPKGDGPSKIQNSNNGTTLGPPPTARQRYVDNQWDFYTR